MKHKSKPKTIKNKKQTNLLSYYCGKNVVIKTKSNIHIFGTYNTFHLGMLKVTECYKVYEDGNHIALKQVLVDRNAIHSMFSVEDIKVSKMDADTKRFINTITQIK